MQQYSFDQLVAIALMLNAAKADDPDFEASLDEVLASYAHDYAGETIAALQFDANEAARRSEIAIDQLVETLGAPRTAIVGAIIRQLHDKARASRSLLKRAFAGTKFNYSAVPLPDRVEAAQKHIAEAATILLATRMRSLDKFLR